MAVAEKKHAGIPNSEAPDETKDDVQEVPMPDPPDRFDFKPSPDLTLKPPKDIEVPPNLDLMNFLPLDPAAPLTTSPHRRAKTPEAPQVKFSIIAACNEVVGKNIKTETFKDGSPLKKSVMEVKPEAVNQKIKTLNKPLDPDLLVEKQTNQTSTSKTQHYEGIPDSETDVLFKQNKQENMADRAKDGLAEPKDTKIFEIQDVKTKGKSLIDNSPTALDLELSEGLSDPRRFTKSNKSAIRRVISNISKKPKKYMRVDRNLASTSKPKEAEISENKDTKADSDEQQEYTNFNILTHHKLTTSPKLSDETPKAAESVNSEDTESEPEQQPRKSAPKQLRKIESASSSDISLSTPGPVKPPKCRKSNKNKLLQHIRDKIVQANSIHKNVTGTTRGNEAKSSDLKGNEPKPKSFKKRRESLALNRGIETASPELGEGASEPSGSRKFNKMKLLPNISKNKTNKIKSMLNKKIACSSRQADNSYFDDIESDSAENLYKSSTPPRQQLGHGTSELIRSRKYKRSNRIKRYRNLSEKNKLKMATRENIASTSKANNDESSETSGLDYQEKNELQLTELSEGTPEPIQPLKRMRPLRMTLLPTGLKENNKKKLLKEKVETSELEESEIDIIVEEMKANNQTTSEPLNDSEQSKSIDLSESTPEPIKPPKRNRAPRMKLLPDYGSARLLSTKEKKGIRSQNSSNSSSGPTTSARAQACSAGHSGNLSPGMPSMSGSQAVLSRTVPRTRVLVTPERKQKKDTSNKQRRLAEKRKWIRNFRQKKQLKSDFKRAKTSYGTSTDSGNIGDCSGPGEDDDNDNIGGEGAKGDYGGSGMGDKGHNRGGTAGDSDSSNYD